MALQTLELFDSPSTEQVSLDGLERLRTYRYANGLGAVVTQPLAYTAERKLIVQPVRYRGFDYVPTKLAGTGRMEYPDAEAVDRFLRVIKELPAQ